MSEADLTAGEITHMKTASELYLHDTCVVLTFNPTTDSFGNPGVPAYATGTTYSCRFAPAVQQEVLADTDVPVLDGTIWFPQSARTSLANSNNRIRVTKRWGSTLGTAETYELEGTVEQEFVLIHVDVRKVTN